MVLCDVKNMTAAIIKNIWGRSGISYLSKHLSHVKMEPHSCFSCKIYILWVVPVLQNRMIWISAGTNWSGGCSVSVQNDHHQLHGTVDSDEQLTDGQPSKLLLGQMGKPVPFHAIDLGCLLLEVWFQICVSTVFALQAHSWIFGAIPGLINVAWNSISPKLF